jgi:hypothetical protein
LICVPGRKAHAPSNSISAQLSQKTLRNYTRLYLSDEIDKNEGNCVMFFVKMRDIAKLAFLNKASQNPVAQLFFYLSDQEVTVAYGSIGKFSQIAW